MWDPPLFLSLPRLLPAWPQVPYIYLFQACPFPTLVGPAGTFLVRTRGRWWPARCAPAATARTRLARGRWRLARRWRPQRGRRWPARRRWPRRRLPRRGREAGEGRAARAFDSARGVHGRTGAQEQQVHTPRELCKRSAPQLATSSLALPVSLSPTETFADVIWL